METLEQENTHLKQVIFKLQTDIKFVRWENAQKDIAFLKEMKGHATKAFKNRDITSREMLLKMIADWIDELEKVD